MTAKVGDLPCNGGTCTTVEFSGITARVDYWRCARTDDHCVDDWHDWKLDIAAMRATIEQGRLGQWPLASSGQYDVRPHCRLVSCDAGMSPGPPLTGLSSSSQACGKTVC